MRVGLTTPGAELAPTTWSGTPWRIAEELRLGGAEVHGLSRATPRALRAALKASSAALGRGSVWMRSNPGRALLARETDSAARRLGCDAVLHTSTLDLPGRGRAVRRYLFCDTTWRQWNANAAEGPAPRRVDAHTTALDRRAYGQMEHVFTVSENARRDLVEHYGLDAGSVTVVGTGRGILEPLAGEKDLSRPLVLWVGRSRFADKGFDLLVAAFELEPALSEVELVVVGPRELEPRLAGIGRARVTGYVPDGELQTLFERATLLAMPALNEPWGYVYLEALVTRTPILGLRRHAFPELAGDGRHGFVVDEARPEAVAAALVDALSDPERLRAMGVAGQEFVLERFSWERVGAAILERMAA